MANITDAECINAVERIEWLYATEAYPPRTDRPVPVDPLGYGRHVGLYTSERLTGSDHETAIRHVEAYCRDIWHQAQIADGVIPPDPEPPKPDKPPRAGVVRFENRCFADDHGCHLGLGFSFFWVPRAFRDYRDRYDANMAYGRDHGFTYYRGLVTTGGWPDPDGWAYAGADKSWAVDLLPQWLDDAWTRYGLRCSLTLFDGQVQFSGMDEQRAYVNRCCDLILPRMHTIQDVQVANEYGPCQWDYEEGIARLREHCRTVRSRLGPQAAVSLSSRNAVMNDEDYDAAAAEAHRLFDGLIPDIVNVSVNHDSREVQHIDGHWRPVRQGWERVLHDQYTGEPLEPDCSIDDEPIGPHSSVAEESNVSLLVQKALVDWVSGRCAYTYHPDSGIWSDLRNPPCVGAPKPMGCFKLITDMDASVPFARAITTLLAVLPPDLPNWGRTRHGLTDPPHPFGKSFPVGPDGVHYHQIWPDGVTHHGVVRSYVAVNGNHWVAPLTGIQDRIDLQWEWALEGRIYRCGDGELVGELTRDQRAYTIPQSVDTDCLIVGHYV